VRPDVLFEFRPDELSVPPVLPYALYSLSPVNNADEIKETLFTIRVFE